MAVLCVCLQLSGCTVAGAVLGGALGAVIGGPDGAVVLGEAGLILGASIDASIVGAMIEGDHRHHEHHDPQVIIVEAPPAYADDAWSAPAHQYEY